MATICPTITAETTDAYRDQIHEVVKFATRLHIDIADGTLAPSRLVGINDVWWPGGVRADLHVMTKQPFEHIDAYLALGPQLVIVHAEAEGDFVSFAEKLHHHGTEAGLALLAETPVETIAPAIDLVDHVLIFSGNFGHFGGDANLNLLEKVKQVRALSSRVEIGWDGGINDENALQLSKAGVEVLNVGGFIHSHDNPQLQFDLLEQLMRK